MVDVRKFDAAISGNANFYVGPGGTGSAIGDRYTSAKDFLGTAVSTGAKVHMPRIYVDKGGAPAIADGRHRFAALRDSGATVIPVSVPREAYRRAKDLFGSD